MSFLMRLLLSCLLMFSSITTTYGNPARHVVFVSLSGYNSCVNSPDVTQTPIFEQTFRVLSDTAAHLGLPVGSMPWASSCFDSVTRSHSNIVVSTSHSVNGFYLSEKISYLAANGGTPPLVVLIGHSWGGMHAVETAIAVKDILLNWSQYPGHEYLAGSKILTATIDPIDSHTCERPILEAFGQFNSCRGFPPTLLANNGALLQKAVSTGSWINFYQESGILSSGPIPPMWPTGFLVQNIKMDYGFSLAPHLSIARDPAVWNMIFQNVLRELY